MFTPYQRYFAEKRGFPPNLWWNNYLLEQPFGESYSVFIALVTVYS